MGSWIGAMEVETAERWLQGSKAENDLVVRKSRDQGNHECQVLGEGHEAAESDFAWKHCTKNPGHGTFIPAPDFSLEHLPGPCRDEKVLDLVRTISALSVRLTVGYTSRKRPDGYTFSNCRGTNIRHTASGCVYGIMTYDFPCPCSSCRQSSSPSQKWYMLNVMTACHVVYDSDEARSTKVDFFYDNKSILEGRVKSLQGMKVLRTDVETDTCEMMCASHDQSLAETLHAQLQQQEWLREAIFSRPNKLLSDWRERLCVVVSHPHGQTKKITVGEVKRWRDGRGVPGTKLLYSADTCPGSSGALVLHLNSCGPGAENLVYWPSHSVGGVDEGLNMSLEGRVMFQHHQLGSLSA